jgi:hypothetical protein
LKSCSCALRGSTKIVVLQKQKKGKSIFLNNSTCQTVLIIWSSLYTHEIIIIIYYFYTYHLILQRSRSLRQEVELMKST